MLIKIITIISIVSLCVNCNAQNHEQRHAISSQSFHRGDVPLSYKYSSVHIYTTPKPEQKQLYHQQNKPNYYQSIQYAPLNSKPLNYHSNPIYSLADQNAHQEITEQDNTERNLKYNLEPRDEAENMDVHNQKYRSYVSGHNIEVLQSNRANIQRHRYPFHKDLQNEKANIPKFVIYQKLERPDNVKSPIDNFEISEQRPLSEDHNILYTFLAKPSANPKYDAFAVKNPQVLRQVLSPKLPRLHLNIARVYGIAHLPQKAPLTNPQAHENKPPSYTQAFFQPLRPPQAQHKTILYPVQDTHKNYPVNIIS